RRSPVDRRLLRAPAADDRGHFRFSRTGGALPQGRAVGGFRRRPRAAWLSSGQADADQSGRRGDGAVIVIPAIDLKDGRCVRLCQGRMQEETVYSKDPADVARRWEDEGAQLLHVVDLDGGVVESPNLEGLRRMAATCPVPVIASGGITRTEDLRQLHVLGPKVIGAIVGKALYEGVLDLRSAMAAVT